MSATKKQGKWQVFLTTKTGKKVKELPANVVEALANLVGDMEQDGPFQKDWPHYGPLKKGKGIPFNAHHCHIKAGRPTYVACWTVQDKKIKIIEIYYVGTHENAPY